MQPAWEFLRVTCVWDGVETPLLVVTVNAIYLVEMLSPYPWLRPGIILLYEDRFTTSEYVE